MKKGIGLVLLAVGLAIPVSAHEVRIEAFQWSPLVLMESTYSGSEPMAGAEAKIFSPENKDKEFQAGRTDVHGYFAFRPDQPGEWTFIVDDGLGHRGEKAMVVSEQFIHAEKKALSGVNNSKASANLFRSMPLSLKIVMGFILIFGLTGCFYWIKARRLIKSNRS